MKRPLSVIVVLLMMVLLAACGGSSPDLAAATVEVAPTTPPEPPPATDVPPTATTAAPAATEPAGIASFRDAMQAAIQIEGQGSFMDPEFGMRFNEAGRGSGFIIDPSGIAVTNNHVVTGAAFLQVWVGGNDEPLNARVLGVSECSDLAVIDIEGDDFPFLVWSAERPRIGTDVYALGFPLGDPEPTITRGIISKENAGGETSWASVNLCGRTTRTALSPGRSSRSTITSM